MKNRFIWMLSLGHLVTDINQGALPALLPFFITEYDLSYTAAASIVFAANVASSIIQPLFGLAADRFSKPWLLSAGLMTAGLGLGMSGFCTTYQLIMVLAVVSGIGIAAYHPEAARLVHFAAGNHKNTAMSIFGVGGNIGFAVGPVFITTALMQWGLPGTVVLIVPVSIMAMVMATQYSAFSQLTQVTKHSPKVPGSRQEQEDWWAFLRLTVVIIGRSIIFFGLNTFIPIYWASHLNQSQVAGSLALSFFAVSGIMGNLAGGNLADRWGQKRVIIMGFLGLTLFLPIFIFIENAHMALLVMIPIGFFLYATFSPSIVLGQSYLPHRVGLSSGITLGVAISIGGAATPFLGKIADVYGIWFAMVAAAYLPVFFALVAMSLPDPRKIRARVNPRSSRDQQRA
ncbi:MFS transporter [Desulfoplanes formicivorans]|uniref:Major facilitator transporter n=1 Tax=Desulfoplanes formicivorans TaxID=1592317 RepID=A0A194AGR4_9BACT|nr:MFS transporter [Desulfoplanes formicivorans]GAU08518.1 major facilitator transporter [Desulfoplanes formicivorans]